MADSAGRGRWIGRLTVVVALCAAACSTASTTTPTATIPAATTPTGTTPTGTTPTGASAAPGVPVATTTAGRPTPVRATPVRATPTPSVVAVQPPLALQAPGRLPDEGRFHAEVVHDGRPILEVAHLRADGIHGRTEAGVVWIDNHSARWELHPGWADPGQLSEWSQPDAIPTAERSSLLATFNGGFKTPELRGGFYEDGHLAGTLLPGAASVVIYRDGHMSLGSWGQEVAMTPQVAAVRQNLAMLIDNGRIVPGLGVNIGPDWGSFGQETFVWRSGLGVTATGDLVYVMGYLLTPQTLANLLLDAGAVRGMEMDINRTWMSFMWYTPSAQPDRPTPHKLTNFERPADRYFSTVSRDFFAIYLR